jgi:hypothetical protein
MLGSPASGHGCASAIARLADRDTNASAFGYEPGRVSLLTAAHEPLVQAQALNHSHPTLPMSWRGFHLAHGES